MRGTSIAAAAAAALLVVAADPDLRSRTVSAADSAKDVLVANLPSQPVPTAAQGTTAVAGTVDARQSGPWRVVAAPAGPFQEKVAVLISSGEVQGSARVAFIPAGGGRRIVVEHMTASAFVDPGNKLFATADVQNVDDTGAPQPPILYRDHFVFTSRGMYNEESESLAATHMTRFVVGPGQGLFIRVERVGSFAGSHFVEFGLTGQEVDLD